MEHDKFDNFDSNKRTDLKTYTVFSFSRAEKKLLLHVNNNCLNCPYSAIKFNIRELCIAVA
jgi:hypothetical protein